MPLEEQPNTGNPRTERVALSDGSILVRVGHLSAIVTSDHLAEAKEKQLLRVWQQCQPEGESSNQEGSDD